MTVKGAVNTAISLRAYGENGELLGTVNDYIRADGDYHWSLNMPGSYEGFFYIGENNSQVRSTWGYVHDMPAISYTGNYAYSLYTSNPQPGFYPEEYEVDSDDLMFYFWSTAVDPSELMDHEVEVWYQGDSDEVKYSENFTNLNAYYYGMGSGTLNATSVGSRYIIMAQDLLSGEDYDGLVIDLANPPGLGTYGAYQPVVVEEGTTDEIGETVSSYWYVSNTGLTYFSTLLSCSECDPASYLAATLSVNAEGGAFDIYDTVQCQIVVDEVDGMSTGTVVNSGTSVAFVSEQTSFDFITPITHGDYYVVFTVSGSGMGINEVLNTPFTVIGGGSSGGETTGEEISNRIDTWLDSAGLDNEFGHWLLLIIGMALAVGIGIYVGKPVIAVPICAGILTLAIVEGWVAPWIVILQAVFIAVAFAKWIAGKGGGND
ncbi:MAG: hypothetical protein GY845_18195 [Planctomycetes bacterium]|nr:hypothetical protein [Planctomycetota bacterium]